MNDPNSGGRWDRLVDTLRANGIDPRLARNAYPGGVNYKVFIRDGDNVIYVIDQWWRKNADKWIGWLVYVEGPDAITVKEWPLTKKRGQVARDVQLALNLGGTE